MDQRVEEIRAALEKPLKADEQRRALSRLQEIGTDEAIKVIEYLFSSNSAVDVRIEAAKVLGQLKSISSITLLSRSMNSDDDEKIRKEAVSALSMIRNKESLVVIREFLLNSKNKNNDLFFSCIKALAGFSPEEAQAVYEELLDREIPLHQKQYIIRQLGEIGAISSVQLIKSYLSESYPPDIRRAAIGTCFKLQGELAVDTIADLSRSDKNIKIRRYCIRILGQIFSERALKTLIEILCTDTLPEIIEESRDALKKIDDWKKKTEKVLEYFTKEKPKRSSINAGELAIAILGKSNKDRVKREVENLLIKESIDAESAVVSAIASLLIAISNNSPAEAGELINAYEQAERLSSGVLKTLRIEVGGATALDPVMEALERVLQDNFQQPTHELNEQTRENWKQMMESAQAGFGTRIFMSQVVFYFGIVIMVVSMSLFFFGKLSDAQLFGAGGSFLSGLATMFAIVYKGPLRDIRQAVSDLGASNVAFIAYIHRILHASHLFSAKYLKQSITTEDTEKLGKLISKAMNETIDQLQYDKRPEKQPQTTEEQSDSATSMSDKSPSDD